MTEQSRRLLIVSNRLPVSAGTAEHDDMVVSPASGGLVSGLRPWHEQDDGLWIGWPGDTEGMSEADRERLDQQLAGARIVPVHLSRDEVERYCHGFANRVLWPLFHYQIDRVPVDATGWEAYQAVNARFAEAIWREYRPGDMIWVHDYQLMLVPALVRARLPQARIGFFLHVPFPSSEVFRVLPWRRELLEGLLGADLVGFHTFAYVRHFVESLLHVDGVEADVDRVEIGDRHVRLGTFPIGIDAQAFIALANDPAVAVKRAAIRRNAGERRIILGVDRLVYTKGIPRRLHAVERMLTRHPELADTVQVIQVAVPSRGEVDSYRRFKRQVEEFVGRINGAFGTLRSAPVHYVHQSMSLAELTALYLAADVMLVTPLRDGMNLVAKEFAATRVDEDGALVLSEFAGAATELDGALIVNPYDVDAVAATILQALALSRKERRARMRALRRQVIRHDVHAWAGRFVRALGEAMPVARPRASVAPGPSLPSAFEAARRAPAVHLLLDYDGTLVPFARSPDAAGPDDELLGLLAALAARPNFHVEIVSGRPREPFGTWMKRLPVSLWAEHGFWHRPAPDQPWSATAEAPPGWQERVRPILEQFVTMTPGSSLEVKTASIAWHFRAAQREHGIRQAHELRMLLGTAFSNQPWGVLAGKKVIEVRLRSADKAVAGARVAAALPADAFIIAIGDERTDDDLFTALPASSIRVAVGRPSRHAPYLLKDPRAVRQALRWLLEDRVPRASAS